ncbi:MAG: type II secretion system protein GspE, partial [Clostridiales bacterium]|nr:type II secretion system protein GspE [Clostridiales bacterium]
MNIDRMKNIRLGEVLIAGGYITEEQLQKALVVQKESQGKRLGEVLVELGFVSERHKLEALSKRCGLPLVSIEKLNVNVDAVARVPLEMAEKYKLLAVDITNGKLVVVINDPLNFFAIEDVRQIVKMPVELNLDSTASIERAIGFYYSEVSARRAVSEANKAVAAPV